MIIKNEEGLREMQDNMKHNNIRIIGMPEGEEEEQGIQNLFEKVMMENFPNLMREKVTEIQETQRVPIKRNPKRPTARHIIIKKAKFQDKETILKAAKEKQEVRYKAAPNRELRNKPKSLWSINIRQWEKKHKIE